VTIVNLVIQNIGGSWTVDCWKGTFLWLHCLRAIPWPPLLHKEIKVLITEIRSRSLLTVIIYNATLLLLMRSLIIEVKGIWYSVTQIAQCSWGSLRRMIKSWRGNRKDGGITQQLCFSTHLIWNNSENNLSGEYHTGGQWAWNVKRWNFMQTTLAWRTRLQRAFHCWLQEGLNMYKTRFYTLIKGDVYSTGHRKFV